MSRVSGKSYWVYVLWSVSASRFYIGISENPSARLVQHNSGLSRWTARYMPWEIVWTESHSNYSQARRKEVYLKKQKGGTGFFLATGLDPIRFARSSGS
jgi:putative endonuclease